MKIKNINRYSPLAVGLKPSARQGEARLRGLERIISSKTNALDHPAGAGCPCSLATSADGEQTSAVYASCSARCDRNPRT
jgi:hypothetical protein